MNCLLFLLFFFLRNSTLKELLNQGRQKVLEATNALKALPREPIEDIIGQLVSNWGGERAVMSNFSGIQYVTIIHNYSANLTSKGNMI